MIDRDLPVTQDELHAYVDGEIPADRRDAFVAWLANHPEDAARVTAWREQANLIKSRYGAVVTEPVPARFDLELMNRPRRQWHIVAAAAIVAAVLGGIAGWMAHGVSAAGLSEFETYAGDALDAHRIFVVEVRHPVEVPGTEREHLGQWLSKRIGYELRIPELEGIDLTLVGGRLLAGAAGATAFLMYESASGERFTIYCSSLGTPETGMRYRETDHFSAFYWADDGHGYVVCGPADRKRLWAIAKAAYDQIEGGAQNKKSAATATPTGG
jgi:anti-sigma factor RsiW